MRITTRNRLGYLSHHNVGGRVELIADRYEWPSTAPRASDVLHPARDTLSGVTVSVLAVRAPDDSAEASREADRLRRYASVRHPHLAEVRTVEERAGLLRVVCEPLEGDLLLDDGDRLDVRSVQRLATGVLEALAALHQAGVTHGAVSARALLLSHRTGPTAEPDVTLLPLPLLPDRPDLGPAAPDLGPGPAGRDADTTPADDVRAAATVLLALLRRTPRVGMEESVLAASLERELERAGGVGVPEAGDGRGTGEGGRVDA